MKLFKGLIFRIFLITINLIIIYNCCNPYTHNFTALEKTRKSNMVILGKCIDIKDEIYSIEFQSFPGKPCTGIRYGRYEILEIWKGDFTDKAIQIDYKTTNEKYPPLVGCFGSDLPADGKLYFQPEQDEIVVLFIEEDSSICFGRQGKVPVDKSTIKLYRDAVANAVEFDNLKGEEKVKMIFDNLEGNNKYISASMRREFRRKIDFRKYSPKIAGLLNKNDSLKQLTLSTLRGISDTSLVSIVIPLLKDTSVQVRRIAVDVLRGIRAERIIPVLIDSYDDPDPIVRKNIIYALSAKYLAVKKKYHDIIAPLIYDAAKDTNIHVRRMGVVSLRNLSEPKATEYLLGALKDDSTSVQSAALVALASHAVSSIVEPVSELLFNGDPKVLGGALSCIDRLAQNNLINPENHMHIIKKLREIVSTDSLDFYSRSKAARILTKIKDPVIFEMVPNFFNDKNYSAKVLAVDIMGESKNRKYIPILKRALSNEENKNVIPYIEYALEKLEGQRPNSKAISPR